MEGDNSIGNQISPKRQKILEKAFAQLRKSRAAMDPSVLSRIRRIVAGSPALMKKLGLTEALKPEVDLDMPLSAKGQNIKPPTSIYPSSVEDKLKATKQGYEKVDQAKNMEVMAKLMALDPSNREKIKSAIKKASD